MRARVITALVAIPIALLAMGLKSPWFLAAVSTIILIRGMIELERLFPWPRKRVYGWLLALAAIVYLLRLPRPLVFEAGAALLAIGSFGLAVAASRQQVGWGSVLGPLWLAAPVAVCYRFHEFGADQFFSLRPLFLLIIPLWGGDTLALLVGRKWGKRAMAPSISPSKTWAGAAGHLMGCLVGTFLYCSLVGWGWPIALATGLSTSVFGQLGDLLQSYAKRAAGLKDSGQVLPGHGGLLDRLDSSLLSAPVTALVVLAMQPLSP